jgi:D-lactate dehydrogenase
MLQVAIPAAAGAVAADYQALEQALLSVIPQKRIVRDPLRALAYGTDASFYRLVPKLVVIVENETEVQTLLAQCRHFNVPVTFRAAGTSLSGQAVTDSVLCVLGDGWGEIRIGADATVVQLAAGVIGSDANRRLAPFGRKIGPDPASINACKVGGIAANNASGMCCGTAQNSYQTVESMRLVLVDGTILDIGDPQSRTAFEVSHRWLLDRLDHLARRTQGDAALAERIRRKFAIKNTTGYSLNALVDFSDPFEILQHLLIGSEGTLGFISSITYRTVPEYADKASALLLFPDIATACRAVIRMKQTPVSAVELIDRASLRSIETKAGIPSYIRELDVAAAALLVETRGESKPHLTQNIAAVTAALDGVQTLRPIAFTDVAAEYEQLWNIRKGLFPSIGGMRPTGTTVIIEDVAFPIASLADATLDLQKLFVEYGYDEAIVFGHALEGNLHFVITPDFGRPAEVDRYRKFMDAVADVVVHRYDGSLKAEHGTGRNMAPFVELEWGSQAYALMQEIKDIFDPGNLLNPGVILNDDPEVHIKNLKPLPAADGIVDTCMECGFCERMCPSQGLTLTPRQRIVGIREISRLAASGQTAERTAISGMYDYQGIDTCAACGLCATACPVGIETGILTKKLRAGRRDEGTRKLAGFVADHYGKTLWATRQGLRLADLTQRTIGAEALENLTGTVRRWSRDRIPSWSRSYPGTVSFSPEPGTPSGRRPKVVYLPSCASRTMGPSCDDHGTESLPNKTAALLEKAGYDVVYPKNLANLCCGQPFESKGLPEVADRKAAEVGEALREASNGGELLIVSDTSPCSYRLKQKLPERLRPLDISEFVHDHVLPRLQVRKRVGVVALHVTCSAKKMGLTAKLTAVTKACAETVVLPENIECCGWAGDKGFTTPELNAHALRTLAAQLPAACTEGYSNSRTCEIGLAKHAGRPYRSIVYLVDSVSEALPAGLPAATASAAE